MTLFTPQPKHPIPIPDPTKPHATQLFLLFWTYPESCLNLVVPSKMLVRFPCFFTSVILFYRLKEFMWQATGNGFQEMRNQHPRQRCKTCAAGKATQLIRIRIYYFQKLGYLLNLNKSKPFFRRDGLQQQHVRRSARCRFSKSVACHGYWWEWLANALWNDRCC